MLIAVFWDLYVSTVYDAGLVSDGMWYTGAITHRKLILTMKHPLKS